MWFEHVLQCYIFFKHVLMKDIINVHSKRCDKSTNRRLQAQQNPKSSVPRWHHDASGRPNKKWSIVWQAVNLTVDVNGNLWEIDENPCQQALYLVGG